MCGIVGAVAERNVTPILVEGLKRLEYRGYDSAGVAVVDDSGALGRTRAVGKVAQLTAQLAEVPRSGMVGIAHTRWATHGVPSEANAHPLVADDRIAVVHNGIIENYLELRDELGTDGFATRSDCEPPLHLYRRYGLDFVDHLRGMYAIALYDPIEGQLVLSRDPFVIKPLYSAQARAGFAFASEPQALVEAGLVTPEVNAEERLELFQLQCTTGASRIFKGINRVLPGESVVVRVGRTVARRRRFGLATEGGALGL